jgi:DNA-binding PadR family transcriptional regulator
MTNAELALLSLLAEQPRYGYEIEQLIEQRGMRAWTELGFSSIYYLLKKLARQGRLKGRRVPGTGAPARVIYSLTSRGASAFRRAVASSLATPARTPPSFLLGLSSLPAISPAQSRHALAQYLARLEERAKQLEAQRRLQAPLPDFVDAMFSYSLALTRREIAWVRRFRDRLGRRPRSRVPIGRPPAGFPPSIPSPSRRRRHEET